MTGPTVGGRTSTSPPCPACVDFAKEAHLTVVELSDRSIRENTTFHQESMSRLSPVYIIQCPGHSHSHLPQVPSVGPNDSLLLDSVVQIHSVCSSKFTTEYMTMIIYFTKRPEFPGSLQHELPSGHTGIQRSKTFFHLERMERTITLKKEPRSNVQRL